MPMLTAVKVERDVNYKKVMASRTITAVIFCSMDFISKSPYIKARYKVIKHMVYLSTLFLAQLLCVVISILYSHYPQLLLMGLLSTLYGIYASFMLLDANKFIRDLTGRNSAALLTWCVMSVAITGVAATFTIVELIQL